MRSEFELEEDESLQIGDNVTVTIVRLRTKWSVKIGVDAPREYPINRGEVDEAKRTGKTPRELRTGYRKP